MNAFIPLSVPNIGESEKKYVMEALNTDWVSTAGKYVEAFEGAMASYVKVPYASSCQSGTAGIHLALMALKIPQDSLIFVPTLTFIAAVNPVRYIGSEPIFIDCDDSLCMDPQKLADYCENKCHMMGDQLIHNTTGKIIPAIIVVHVFGNMADMKAILEIGKKYNLRIIEDATEALGTYYISGAYKDCHAGTLGDIGVYSFNGNKIITTGGGGMVVSHNKSLIDHVKHLSTQAKSDPVYYTHDEVGYNYRMTNVQAAIGLGQLEKIETFIQYKIDHYDIYKKALKHLDGVTMIEFREDIRSNHWFYSLYWDREVPTPKEVIDSLNAEAIQARPIWGLIHKQHPYIDSIRGEMNCSDYYAKHIVNIPCSPNMTRAEVNRVTDAIFNMKFWR